MKIVFGLMIATVAVILIAATFAINGKSETQQTVINPVPEVHPAVAVTKEYLVCEELGVAEWEVNIPEYEISWAQMVQEISTTWKLFYDYQGVSFSDSRRDNFDLYAEYLADTIIVYQNRKTDIGGRLPRHESTHFMLAWLLAKESAATPDAVGKKGEVGMLQTHGLALAGIDPKVVARNPKLGIFLGVRWLAASIPYCFPDGTDDANWSDDDWLGVLSVYGGGAQRALRKDGTCKKFDIAKKKVQKMKMYRAWVSAELDTMGR